MVVVLVVLTFLFFIIVDSLLRRRRVAKLLHEGEALQNAMDEAEPHWVSGFKLPQELSYHPGHTWVHCVSQDQAYVGLDDFARRLIGRDARLSLPDVGAQLTQGEDAVTIQREGRHAAVLSPIAGKVVGINPRLKQDPEIAFREHYGRGWLFKLKSPSLVRDLNNLLGGSLAKRWMEDTQARFQHQLVLASGSVIRDGGMPVEDIAAELNPDDWQTLVEEFLTLRSQGR